jgi:hypothetical protein
LFHYISKLPSVVIFLLPDDAPLILLIVQMCWQRILSVLFLSNENDSDEKWEG